MQRRVLGDRYTLLEVLGDGGMARVHLARDNVLERDVALKILRDAYADDEGFVERFRREAKNAASLNHPSIVQVYDQGRAEDGTYFMAMEYVPGGTLKERLVREGPLDPREAAGIASRVAEALGTAHARGIVHRDIKPQNVLLTASGDAKVADFGIARAASSKTMTETNLILGTASYMSPEQVRGERAGPASDLYSLGVVLYEMLTGSVPYEAEDPIATAMKHLDEPPPHPGKLNPEIPEGLDALVVKLLAKEPEERYASAATLAEDLRRVRDGLPPLAAELVEGDTVPLQENSGRTRTAPTMVAPGREQGARGRWRRFLPLIAALLAGAALLGGIALALSQSVEVPRVVGLPRVEAQRHLEAAGLKVGTQNQQQSAEVPEGVVIAQNPRAGTQAVRGAAVDLTISSGPAQNPITTASPSATSSASSSATSSSATSSSATSSSSASSSSSTPPAPPASNAEPQKAQEDQKGKGEAAKESKKEPKKPPPAAPGPHKKSPQKSPS
jgi:serine/threonine-protein kinase